MDKICYNIKTGLMYLARQKNISLMNLLGLSIGMTVAILIFFFVTFEMNYDNFHKDGKLIYRIISVNKGTGGTDYRAATPFPLPDAIRKDIKDVAMTTGLSLFLSDDEPVKIADQSFLAIFLSCLGLFALIAWLSLWRSKEIGIRKINGASIIAVMYMFSSDYIKLVAVAFLIASPIAWFIMDKWLQNFACKTGFSWWIFGLSGIIALGIALLTVSLQTWRAATKNPVDALDMNKTF